MKKKYDKPQIFIEKFSLCTSVAAGCEKKVTTFAQDECAFYGTGSIAMFSGTISDCDYKVEDMGGPTDEWEGFCYHVPLEDNDLFNS